MNKYLNLTIKAEKMKMPGKIKCFQDGHCFCECYITGIYKQRDCVVYLYYTRLTYAA